MYGQTHTRGNRAMGPWFDERIAARSKTYRMQEVSDGLSNTIAMSERRVGDYQNDQDIGNVAYDFFPIREDNDPLIAREECRKTVLTKTGGYAAKYNPNVRIIGGQGSLERDRPGERWGDGRPYYAGFNTIIEPNGPSCAEDNGDWFNGIYTASSMHPSVVNVMMGDASIRKIHQSIDAKTWWAMGTRSGDESYEMPEY